MKEDCGWTLRGIHCVQYVENICTIYIVVH
jgi:hypothetical protein